MRMNLRSHASIDAIVVRYIWSHIEPATAILSACLATYRPLFVDLHLRLPSILSGGKSGSTNRTTWSESRTERITHTGSSAAVAGNDTERQSLNDHYPMGQLQMDRRRVDEDPFTSNSPSKRQQSEATIESDVMATPAEQERPWQY